MTRNQFNKAASHLCDMCRDEECTKGCKEMAAIDKMFNEYEEHKKLLNKLTRIKNRSFKKKKAI